MKYWSWLQFWWHCSWDALASGVLPSSLVLLFMQHSNNFGHHFDLVWVLFSLQWSCFPPFFNVGVVDYATILLFWL